MLLRIPIPKSIRRFTGRVKATSAPCVGWYQRLRRIEIVRALVAYIFADDAHVLVARRDHLDAPYPLDLFDLLLCPFDTRNRGGRRRLGPANTGAGATDRLLGVP